MPACSASYPCGEGSCALSAASFLASHSHWMAVRGFRQPRHSRCRNLAAPAGDTSSLAGRHLPTCRRSGPAGPDIPTHRPGARRAAPGGATSWS